MIRRHWTLAMGTVAWLFALTTATPAAAQTSSSPSAPGQTVTVTGTAPLAIAEYAKLPEYQQPILSPNGKFLAVLVPIKGKVNLAVIDLEKLSSRVLTSIERYDVFNVFWVGNERLVFNLGNRNLPTGPGVDDGGGLFMVGREGGESRVLSPTAREVNEGNAPRISGVRSGYLDTRVLHTWPDNDKEILIEETGRSADSADVYRLDVTTSRRTLITESRPERTSGFTLDRQRMPRVATSGVRDQNSEIIWYRDSMQSPWREIARFTDLASKGGSVDFSVVGFDADNKNLIVSTAAGRDTTALFKYDVDAKKLGAMLAGHPKYDIGGGGIWRRSDGELLGVAWAGDKREVVWFDESVARVQATIDKALPARFNTIAGSSGPAPKYVVTSMSDVQTPIYYLFDEEKRRLEPLVASMPWLKPEHLVEMRPFDLKTRDGLSIPSYYFLPKSYKQGDRLPTVIHIHGGPQARADRWGPASIGGTGVREAQVLASRGYAVVLPNFRVTPELGSKILLAGKQSLGRSMQEDHEDAAKWAIDQGFADGKRMCITGASYGGYATLRALAKTPDLFKCGIAGLSVSDWDLMKTSTSGDTAYSQQGASYIDTWLIGKEHVTAVSPVNDAAKMTAPLMMYAGAADIRTPIEQTNRMARALRSVGREPEMLIKTEEGHGFGVLANRVELWEKMLAFLEKHIGVGPTKP